MKRILISISFILLLTACGNEPDYEGQILEVKDTSIIVGEGKTDPEEQYPSFKILINDNTEINGEATKFSELNAHQKIKVWITEESLSVNSSQTAREISIEGS